MQEENEPTQDSAVDEAASTETSNETNPSSGGADVPTHDANLNGSEGDDDPEAPIETPFPAGDPTEGESPQPEGESTDSVSEETPSGEESTGSEGGGL